MADEIWVDPEKLWTLAGKINAEPSNLLAAASGIGGVINLLPDAVRNRVISYIPTNSDLQLCVDAMSDLAAFLQQKAMAFAYLDGYDYFLMEGGGPSPTDAMLIESSMFAGSMFAGSMFAGSIFGRMVNGSMSISDAKNILGYGTDGAINLVAELGHANMAGAWLNISEEGWAKFATFSLRERATFAGKYLKEYEKFDKGVSKVGAGVGFAVDYAFRVTDDWNDYDGGEFATVLAVDAVESGLVTAAGYGGGVAGAAIGTMICPGVGTVIGGFVGSIVVGWTASIIMDEFDNSDLKRDIVGGITDGVGAAADGVSDAVGWAGNTIDDFCDSLL